MGLWDLFYSGHPPDLAPFSDAFAKRFADYCWTNQWTLGEEGDPLADEHSERVALRDLVKKFIVATEETCSSPRLRMTAKIISAPCADAGVRLI